MTESVRVFMQTERKSRLGDVSKCSGCIQNEMTYMQFISFSEQCRKRRIKQVKCSQCGLWTWPEHLKEESYE